MNSYECFQLQENPFVLSLQTFLWIFCRVQSLGPSAESFDKPSPRHLFTQTWRYPKRYNYPPFCFYLETFKIITFCECSCQQKE